MNKIRLFFLLRRNTKLSERRHPMFEANQYGRLFGYIMIGFVAIELIALGTFFGWLGATEDVPEVIFLLVPFLLAFDFGARFMTQQTPLMLVKPYLLTPVSKFSAIECFLVGQLADLGNLVWMLLFVPYAFVVWCGGLGGWTVLAMLLLLHLMVLVNSQWYLMVRTLVNQHLLWWLLPAALYGSMVLPFVVLSDATAEKLFDTIGNVLAHYGFSWWALAVEGVLFVALFALNRYMQMHLVYDEIAKNESTRLGHVSEFRALNRFGQIGEYLKLEIKSTMRNKAIRSRFIQGAAIVAFFSLMIAFTNVYNSTFEHDFWCLYAFVIFGAMGLAKVMCAEGNYIDFLMTHKENILTLLRAKYYYYSAVLLLPLAFCLVPVAAGKFSLIMVLAYLFTTTGPVYMMLFQMAVYNKQTLPLNDKLTGKNQMENKWQAIVTMAAMFVPIIVVNIFRLIASGEAAYWALFVTGLVVTLCEPLWMSNIYRRMMARRYDNLEGFHTTR